MTIHFSVPQCESRARQFSLSLCRSIRPYSFETVKHVITHFIANYGEWFTILVYCISNTVVQFQLGRLELKR